MVYKNIPAAFTIDWIDGFLLKPFASPSYHFVYGFSQLKGSSDDGKATLTLQFQEAKRPGMKPNLIKEGDQKVEKFRFGAKRKNSSSTPPVFLSRDTRYKENPTAEDLIMK